MDPRVRLREDIDDDQKMPSRSSPAENDHGGVSDASSSATDSVTSENDLDSSSSNSESTEGFDSVSEASDISVEQGASLKDISFGALVEAQAAFPPKSRKRKAPQELDEGPDQKKGHQKIEAFQNPLKKDELRPKPARQSKHAPTILSSRQQVSRKRDVFDPSPALKYRDPRFDPTIQAANYNNNNAIEKANKNYSFLTSYQAAEILDLKSQIKKTKDPDMVTGLKRKVMSIESKIRNAQARQREKEIMQQHRQKEKEAIRTGQKAKPYYLKESEAKKMANQERVDSLSKKARDKAAQRKQKREKTKDARDMPRVRRE